jgi:alpha-glucosidase (family GH31 glycosyl hydrolase)
MAQITIPTEFPSRANPSATVTGEHVRFTVLTSRMIRMEYSRHNRFEDRASQAFWYREQPVPEFQRNETADGVAGDHIDIETEHLHLCYKVSDAGFTMNTLSIELKGSGVTWRFGDRDHYNLRGTARTLDGANGEIDLEPGLMSRSGWSLVDDSQSLVFNQSGWLEQRPPARTAEYRDLYFLGYGQDYIGCLQEYTRVSGCVPMVPRYALGNWWSRYWDYKQDELRDLMVEFREREVPLSVCIIDMDWHITKTGNASSGWTGYTWNREQWPDPYGFIAWLHEQGLRTAMNLHPADGIWPHEAQYEEMARFMGQDPASGEPVPFDLADPHFVEGYFKILHHPMEAEGVDFWWLDWQQGQRMVHSAQPVAEVMDPLWWLNHLHFYDLGRDGTKRPFIFSRWGGLGNQRYPIGFSGDSWVTWATLAFQPYFTATASNVAFGWWSHDVGGHCAGVEEPELYARWVQLGAFSPILRLHSTNNPFHDRRPWGNGADAFRVARDAMQLRHALIPYIYSMAWRMTQQSIPLVMPLYYWHGAREEAYLCRNQFYFGSELMVAPFVSPRHPETNLSRHTVWLPEGDWFDFTTGEHFAGDQTVALYGTLDDIPVFARAGSIVPLGPRAGWGGVDNPEELTLYIFPGADGHFTLYEDDGNSTAYLQGDHAVTELTQTWGDSELTFTVAKATGNPAHIPASRRYSIVLRGVRNPSGVRLAVNGTVHEVQGQYDAATESLTLPFVPCGPTDELTLTVSVADGALLSKRDRRVETCRAMLWAFKLDSLAKMTLDRVLPHLAENLDLLGQYGGEIDRISEAQLMALRNVLERRQ